MARGLTDGKNYVVPGLKTLRLNSSGTRGQGRGMDRVRDLLCCPALAAGAPAGASFPFQNPWASLPNLTPDLTECLQFAYTAYLKPGTFALTSLGAISFLLFLGRQDATKKLGATARPDDCSFTLALPLNSKHDRPFVCHYSFLSLSEFCFI